MVMGFLGAAATVTVAVAVALLGLDVRKRKGAAYKVAPFCCNLFSFILLAFVVLNFREHLRLFSYIRGYNLG